MIGSEVEVEGNRCRFSCRWEMRSKEVEVGRCERGYEIVRDKNDCIG